MSIAHVQVYLIMKHGLTSLTKSKTDDIFEKRAHFGHIWDTSFALSFTVLESLAKSVYLKGGKQRRYFLLLLSQKALHGAA